MFNILPFTLLPFSHILTIHHKHRFNGRTKPHLMGLSQFPIIRYVHSFHIPEIINICVHFRDSLRRDFKRWVVFWNKCPHHTPFLHYGNWALILPAALIPHEIQGKSFPGFPSPPAPPALNLAFSFQDTLASPVTPLTACSNQSISLHLRCNHLVTTRGKKYIMFIYFFNLISMWKLENRNKHKENENLPWWYPHECYLEDSLPRMATTMFCRAAPTITDPSVGPSGSPII